MLRSLSLCSFLVAALLAAACSESPEERVVARIGDRVITEQMFQDRVQNGGPSTVTRAKTKAGRLAILEAMVKHEMLLAEAERRNMRGDRGVRDTLNPILSKRILEKEFEPTIRIEDVPEEEIRAIYQERYDEFHQPETFRFSVIQTVDEAKARELLERVRIANNDVDVFDTLATTEDNIDPQLRADEGGIGYLPLEDLRRAVPDHLRPTFERLKESMKWPEIVTTSRGTFLVMMSGKRPGLNREYDSVRSGLRMQAFRRHREKKLEEFVAGFRKNHKVTINYELLSLVRVLPPERREARRRTAETSKTRDAGVARSDAGARRSDAGAVRRDAGAE